VVGAEQGLWIIPLERDSAPRPATGFWGLYTTASLFAGVSTIHIMAWMSARDAGFFPLLT
jgi:hypothetical protein